MRRQRQSESVQDSRHDVDPFDEARIGGAARNVRGRRRIVEQKRHPHDLVVQELLLAQAPIAQEITVVRGEHDQRVAHPSRGVERL